MELRVEFYIFESQLINCCVSRLGSVFFLITQMLIRNRTQAKQVGQAEENKMNNDKDLWILLYYLFISTY